MNEPSLYRWDDSEFDGINLPIESVGKGAYSTFRDALVGIGVLKPVELAAYIDIVWDESWIGNHRPDFDDNFDTLPEGRYAIVPVREVTDE